MVQERDQVIVQGQEAISEIQDREEIVQVEIVQISLEIIVLVEIVPEVNQVIVQDQEIQNQEVILDINLGEIVQNHEMILEINQTMVQDQEVIRDINLGEIVPEVNQVIVQDQEIQNQKNIIQINPEQVSIGINQEIQIKNHILKDLILENLLIKKEAINLIIDLEIISKEDKNKLIFLKIYKPIFLFL